MELRVLMIILTVVASIYLFGGNKNASITISDNYGQYDEGSAMCDKGVMLEERLDWIQRVQNQVDIQQAAEQLEALMGLIGVLVFEVALQLTAQAIIAVL